MKADPKSEDEAVGGVPARLLDGYDGGTTPSPELIAELLASAPPEVRARAAEFARQSKSASDHSDCICLQPGAAVEWTDRADIGMTNNYWEVTRMRCAKCQRPWIRAFIEYEAFPRSGRFYRAPSTDAALDRVSPAAGMAIIEDAEIKIAGGSYFDGVEHVVRGHGRLVASP